MKKRDIQKYSLLSLLILVASGFLYYWFALRGKDSTEAAPLPETIRILPLGNSITQATSGYNSYRRGLWIKLNDAGYSIDFVGTLNQNNYCGSFPEEDFDHDHEGHWGWTTDDILNGLRDGCSGEGRLEDWVESYTADMAIVHLGSNDMFMGESVRSTLNEMERVIDILRQDNPWVTIFLARLIPCTDPTFDARIRDLNTALSKMVSRKNRGGSKIVIVDQYTGFDAATDTFDGIHPNEVGEEKIAENWFVAIDDFLSK